MRCEWLTITDPNRRGLLKQALSFSPVSQCALGPEEIHIQLQELTMGKRTQRDLPLLRSEEEAWT